MKTYIYPSVAAGLAVAVAAFIAANRSSAGYPRHRIEQGRHLVENVGMCIDCHAARNPDGSFDRSRWLLGSPLAFAPTMAMPWAPAAPPIAGLPTMTDEQAVHYLMTGERPNGLPTLPPMPSFRLSKEEAEAVVAYLRSVAPRS